jgi:hypothetical protein
VRDPPSPRCSRSAAPRTRRLLAIVPDTSTFSNQTTRTHPHPGTRDSTQLRLDLRVVQRPVGKCACCRAARADSWDAAPAARGSRPRPRSSRRLDRDLPYLLEPPLTGPGGNPPRTLGPRCARAPVSKT